MNPSQLPLLDISNDNLASRLFAVHIVDSDDSVVLVLKIHVKSQVVEIRQIIDHRDAQLLELADD